MKIAFAGKGGSGKSTMSSLFIKYLETTNRNVLAIDADINMNLSGLLGGAINQEKLLSNPNVKQEIRTYLKGNNPRIDAGKFVHTTPPGEGSNLITEANDKTMSKFAESLSVNPAINLMTVGSYDQEGIGQSCYHTTLTIAENILTHTKMSENNWMVCDMVAGTDAFAYSMHLQFDAIILIAEPTPESLEVCKLYLDLAKEAEISPLVHVVANKVEDEEDLAYISDSIGQAPIAILPVMSNLKKMRQRGTGITFEFITGDVLAVMKTIEDVAENTEISWNERLKKLYKLHEITNAQEWIKITYGDVMDQIDDAFLDKVAA